MKRKVMEKVWNLDVCNLECVALSEGEISGSFINDDDWWG